MYGYVVPFKEKLAMENFVLYRAFYCGLCKSTGKLFGQFPRFTTNYDMTFFGVFLHDCKTFDVSLKEESCVCNPFKKKPIAKSSLVDEIAAVNIILSYYKAVDGVIDGEGVKMRMIKRALKKPFKKASAICPEVERITREKYEALRKAEQGGFKGIDSAADCFASMLRDITECLLGESADEYKKGVAYNIGKLVYLIDALDDVDEDFAKKRYNPLIAEFGNYENREQFIRDNYDDLSFILNGTCNRAIADFNNIEFTQSRDLMQNILYHGIREKIKELLNSKKKLSKPKI